MPVRRISLPFLAVGISGRGRLDELTYEPPTTPEQWCEHTPCIDVGRPTLDDRESDDSDSDVTSAAVA